MSDMPTSAELRDEMRDTITTLRAELAAARGRERRLREALEEIADARNGSASVARAALAAYKQEIGG